MHDPMNITQFNIFYNYILFQDVAHIKLHKKILFQNT